MRKLITLFLALLLSVSAAPTTTISAAEQKPVPRSTRHSLCRAEIPSPEDFGNRIARSLASDSTGRRRIEGCRVTPLDVLKGYEGMSGPHPTTLEALPDWYRIGWVEITPEPGVKHWTSCKDDAGRMIARCLAREPRAKSIHNPSRPERVWKKGDETLFGDCWNGRGEPDKPTVPNRPQDDCRYINLYVKAGDEVRIIHKKDPVKAADMYRCIALWKVGEAGWTTTLLDECPRANCVEGSDWFRTVSFKVEQTGVVVLRVGGSVEVSPGQFEFCIIREHEGRQTLSTIITKRAYVKRHAFIGYPGQNVPPEGWNGLMHTWRFTDGRPG